MAKKKPDELKKQIVSELVAVRRDLLEAAAALPTDAQARVFLGVWSAWDLLGHLSGWDCANIEALHAIPAGRLPAFYAHHDPGWKTYNERLVAEHRRPTFDDQITWAADSLQKLLYVLETLPPDCLAQDFGLRVGAYHVTIERILRAEITDERKHLQQMQEFAASL